MKIALIHDWLNGMRGGEKCLEVLCRQFPDARLFTLLHAQGSTSERIERMRITTSFLQRIPGAVRHYRYLLPLMPRAAESLPIPRDVDLVVSFSHAVAKSVKPPPGVPHVCYCFTPMRYAWHRRDDYFPASGSVISGRFSKTPVDAVRNFMLDRLCRWDCATSERVTHFVAISQTVAERIRQCYDRPSEIIYPPVDTNFYSPAEVPREDFLLCVSALVPYKRIDLAVEACNRLGHRLVVIGDGPQRKRLEQLAGPTVELLGWQSDQQILDHMRRASALLFPGNEDFGIVPLEAQACGTPVLAFAAGGAMETVIPGTEQTPGSGLFFAEQTAESLCEAIERFEGHPTWFDANVARHQAEKFRGERFKRELIEYLQSVVEDTLSEHQKRECLGPDYSYQPEAQAR